MGDSVSALMDIKNAALLSREEERSAANLEKQGFLSDFGTGVTQLARSALSGDETIRRQALIDSDSLSDFEKAKQLANLGTRTEVPDTIGGAAGTGTSEATAMAVVGGLIARRVPIINGAGRVRSAVQNTISEYGQLFRANPITTTASEGFLGGASAGGGFTLKEAYPDLPAAQFIGEVVTGVSAGTAVPFIFNKLTPTGLIINKGKDFFSPEGATSRAATRMQSLADPELALKTLRSSTDLSPNAAFTTAQRTGQKGLIELENTIIKAANDGQLSQQYADMLQQTNQAIRDDLDFGGVFTEDIQNFYSHQVEHFGALLDARIAVAGERANTAALKVSPAQTKEALEISARTEIESAYKEARGLEDALYSATDPKLSVDVAVSRSARENWIDELSEATLPNMPSAATFLDPKSAKYIGRVQTKDGVTNQLGSTTVKELRGVQSALRAEARAARSGETPNRQKAMIADELADSITEDISRIYMDEEGANPVALAVSFSRELNERFSRGPVGKILGRSGTGADRIPSPITLSSTLGVSSASNLVAYDSILKAVDGNPVVQASMEDFLKFKFFRGAEFDAQKAHKFLLDNEDLMSRMPVFRSEIQDAISTGNTSRLTQRTTGGFADPRVNKAVVFIEKGPEAAFTSVLNSRATGKEMQQLIRMANRDVTGEALQGLRTSFTSWMFKNATNNNTGFIQGSALAEGFNNRKVKIMMSQLFDKKEKARFERAVRTARLLDSAANTTTLQEGVSTDKLNGLLSVIAGVTGAKTGRFFSNTIQGPGIFAQKFRELAQAGVVNPALNMLTAAIHDEELFKALLEIQLGGRGGNRVPTTKATRAINAWMGVTLKNLGTEDQEEQQQQTVTQ